MSISVVSRNSFCKESVSRACRDRNIVTQCQCDTIELLDAESMGDVLLWHFTADDADPQHDIRSFASKHPQIKIIALAPNALCDRLETECGDVLATIIPESASADAVISVLLLAEQGFSSRRATDMSAFRRPEPAPHPPKNGHNGVVNPPPQTSNSRGLLSDREIAVLNYLCAGYSNKSIARELGICDATVKAHLRSSFRRIGAINRTQAAIWASKNLGR